MPQTQLTRVQFQELIESTVTKAMEAAGMTRVDRRHGVFPQGLNPANNPSKNIADMSKTERTVEFFRAIARPDMSAYDVRALAEGTDSTGGFLVPEDFRAKVIIALEKVNAMRSLCFIIPMKGDTMTVPAVASKPTATWTGERVAHTESGPTFGQVQLIANKLSIFSKTSEELLTDAAVEVEALLVKLFAEAFRNSENAAFTTGTGIGQPVGILPHLDGSSYEKTPSGGAGTIKPEDIVDLFYALPVQYREQAVWVLHNLVIAKIRKMRTDSGASAGTGGFIWTDGFGTTPATLMGKPVFENNDLPTTRGAANRSAILFGDFSYYYIGDRKQMAVKASTEAASGSDSAFLQDELWLKASERIDGQVALDEAFIIMDEVPTT